jgi:hypothetical protein
MAQHDYVIANGSGSAVRSDLNNALAAIVSTNSGASEPSPTYAYQLWADTTAGVLKIRNGANNAWITLRELDGTLIVESGSASAPGIYFGSLATTGIYSPGLGQVAITTNSTQRVTWTLAGAIFNDGGENYDFRVEGDTKPNLFSIDASADAVSFDGNVTIANQNDLRFGDSDNSNWVALQAPATVSSNVTWTLPAADGTADQVLKTDGSGALGWVTTARMTLATAQNSTSGTSIDFTSIPSWVKRITVMFDKVSTNGTSVKLIQLGDSGGVETTGYEGGSQVVLSNVGFSGSYSTAGIPINSTAATHSLSGSIVFTLLNASANTWAAQGVLAEPVSNSTIYSAGSKSLSATLDRIRVTTVNGTDTFDAGSINILYEG